MKKNLKLRPFVLPTIYVLSILTLIISVYYTAKTLKTSEESYNTYVTEAILDNDIPVVNTKITMISPYKDANVTIGKGFYDYKGDSDSQEKSIIFYENTYMQNSGVSYSSEKIFDVISVLDGIVISVESNDILGTTVEIRHDNDLISVYQSLSNVNVKKDDKVIQGQIIAKSGLSNIEKDLGNHLHFELYYKGKIVNPDEYYNKSLD